MQFRVKPRTSKTGGNLQKKKKTNTKDDLKVVPPICFQALPLVLKNIYSVNTVSQ